VEYKQESYKLFDELLTRIRNETIMKLFRLQVPKLTMPRKYRDRIRTYKPAAATATAAPRGQAVPPGRAPVTGEIKVEKASSRRRRRSKKKKK